MQIKVVRVIGASGNMGTKISALFAGFLDAKVFLLTRDISKKNQILQNVVKSIKQESVATNLFVESMDNLEKCVKESDLIFESLPENFELKKNFLDRVSKVVKPNCIICSGSSGLSITNLCKDFQEFQKSNFFGMHFFNPPYSMQLCELVYTQYSNIKILEELKKVLQDKMYKDVVTIKDTPLYLANRIGIMFLNLCLKKSVEFSKSGGVDYIDAIMGNYTGRFMPPIKTIDLVGIDVFKVCLKTAYNELPLEEKPYFDFSNYINKDIKSFYISSQDKQLVYDFQIGDYRNQMSYSFKYASDMKDLIKNAEYFKALERLFTDKSVEANICKQLLLEYIIYSNKVCTSLGVEPKEIDKCMAYGYNWCPPFVLLSLIKNIKNIKLLVGDILSKKQYDEFLEMLDIDIDNKIDYRIYFRAN